MCHVFTVNRSKKLCILQVSVRSNDMLLVEFLGGFNDVLQKLEIEVMTSQPKERSFCTFQKELYDRKVDKPEE